jgi:ATP-dependent DNA helicase RecG
MPIAVTKINDDEVEALLLTEEGHFLDLKSVDTTPARVSDAVSAFADTSGGELFIGIDERIGNSGRERKWRGFPTQEDANGLIQTLEAMSPLGNHKYGLFLQLSEPRVSRNLKRRQITQS